MKNDSSCAHAGDATWMVSTPPRSRPGSVRAAIRSPTERRHASRSITTPPARAVTSRACSSKAPSEDGEREREPEPAAEGDARRGGWFTD